MNAKKEQLPSDFVKAFVQFFTAKGYLFQIDYGTALRKPTPTSDALMRILTSQLLGPLAASTINTAGVSGAELQPPLSRLHSLCDIAAVRTQSGMVQLALATLADNHSFPSLQQQFVSIESLMKEFKALAATAQYGLKFPVFCHNFLVFSDSKPANEFRASVHARCKRIQFWNKINVLPWVVNLPESSVHRYPGWPIAAFSERELVAAFFNNNGSTT